MAESTDPRGRTYCGQQVTVYDDARRCTHRTDGRGPDFRAPAPLVVRELTAVVRKGLGLTA